ncbi:MAG: DNA repair protein RecO [Tindallia sp. MSAO_Bac2]|nr:MAG: DNA repair protein RecO [Tindallia sp. MSAO_Bac2]
MLVNTQAFVLKSQKYRESDSLLVLYSKQYGKISAVAKGSRKPKSKMLSGVQPFVHAEYLLYKGKSMYTVNQVEVQHSFYSLREDYNRLTSASYVVELVLAEATEGQGNESVFSLLGNTLTLMCREETNLPSLLRAFELKLMTHAGYSPNFLVCANCGADEKTDRHFFSSSQGGIVCKECHRNIEDSVMVSANLIKLARFYLQNNIKSAARIEVPARTNKQLQQLMEGYIRYHFEFFSPKSLLLMKD